MSSQMIVMSNFGNTLMILEHNVINMSLKMWLLLITFLIISKVTGVFEFSMKYRRPIIFRYNLDWGSHGVSTWSASICLEFFMYFSIVCKSKVKATLLVTMTMLDFSV